MRVESVQIGMPREFAWRGRRVLSGIRKEPVSGPVQAGATGLAGDGQADLSVHGGIEKAVYAYPCEHRSYWRSEIPGMEVGPGAFGENLSVEGLLEEEVCVGDELEIGSAMLRVTQPRVPCFKLGMRHERADLVKRFHASGRTGFYLAVVRPGSFREGDAIRRASRDERRFSIRAANELAADADAALESLRLAAEHPHLAVAWKDQLRGRIRAASEEEAR